MPTRAAVPSLAATVNETGLSPACGIEVVTVIHATSDSAVHRHAFCVAPPQVKGSLCWSTSNRPVPPTAPKLRLVALTP